MIITFRLVTDNGIVLDIATNADYETSSDDLFVEVAADSVIEIPRSRYDNMKTSYEQKTPNMDFAVGVIESAKKSIARLLDEGPLDRVSMAMLHFDLVFILIAISKGLLPKIPLAMRH